MERKLAHIEVISEIMEHGNAETLEIAKVLGWACVVLKGQFKAGQTVVFIEPDAILPEGRPEWEFMRERGFRIKTIRLRGVVSQGLVFPEEILDNPPTYGPRLIGDDVTEVLGIKKYEVYVPAQLAGVVKGNFPEFLHKTDEMRIQAVPGVLYRHQNKKFYVTEKLDGSSMTVYLRHDPETGSPTFGVCSRNLELKESEGNSYWKVARDLDLEGKMISRTIMSDYPLLNFSLQGELIGPGVQKNKYGLDKLQFRVFNIFNIDTGKYLPYTQFVDIAEKMGLQTVPVLLTDYILSETVEEMVEFSKGKSVLSKTAHREGVIFRPLVEEYDEDLGRLSFKVINPDFLLKNDD